MDDNTPTSDTGFDAAPALVAGVRDALWLSRDGEIETLGHRETQNRIRDGVRPLVCHRRLTAATIRAGQFQGFDILELFAFVRPAVFCLPTPAGVAQSLDLPLPEGAEQTAAMLFEAADILLAELAKAPPEAKDIAWSMARAGWPWGAAVLTRLGGGEAPHSSAMRGAMQVWRRLSDWEDRPRETPAGSLPVSESETRTRLGMLLGRTSERRPQQQRYAETVTAAFKPRDTEDEPNVVIAEAGTGVGKTLGYVAPASLWAEHNDAPVWIATYTRNLQRQLDTELDRLYPDRQMKRERIVVRKGRENYMCLLNYEEALGRAQLADGPDAIALGLIARWIRATRDGDMVGGDFPSWLTHLYGREVTTDLTDTRGECIYSACPHYGKCFIEHTQRRARHADLVVANHALVMINAAMGGDPEARPLRYVFDEAHHLFNAADSAFSANLSGMETAELRRWLIGAEGGSRSRSRGLKARVEELIAGNEAAEDALEDALRAAKALAGPGWHQRIGDDRPEGPTEKFLALVRNQVYARARDADGPYDLEAEPHPAIDGLVAAALALKNDLHDIQRPLTELMVALHKVLADDADTLETQTRTKIESVTASLERRAVSQLSAWRAMLDAVADERPPEFVDWFGIQRLGGRDFDVGFHRHWVDPTEPLATTVYKPAHGIVITSATLTDRTGDPDTDWQAAEIRTGTRHLALRPLLTREESPFDHARNLKVLVVGDVRKNDMDQTAAAYRELFKASDGGGLGLFTAISRLRAVEKRIREPLEDSGIPLLAQHVDPLDTGTLVDIFRAEEHACLLGTDAVRDGVDVPGRSLRLLIFDRVPWPRPDLLHKARRAAFGGKAYDEMLTRLKLSQAIGRLLRRATDKGIFVMLDRQLPSRMETAFPAGVAVERVGMKDAIDITRSFLAERD
ncbi:MAG: ATP-dependent DNA helicase [Rhodospirillales bacterium]